MQMTKPSGMLQNTLKNLFLLHIPTPELFARQ
jgi:hypothetical protein